MKTLRPVEFKQKYINAIANGMKDYFAQTIFNPMFDILKNDMSVYNNAMDILLAKIQSGDIYYAYGAFRTEKNFSADIVKEFEKLGAKFRNNAFYIDENALPVPIRSALDIVKVKTAAKYAALTRFLVSYEPSTVNLGEFISSFAEMGFRQLEADLMKSAQEKKVPVIELGIVNPKTDVSKEDIKKLDDYWKSVEDKQKELEQKIKTLKDEEKKRKKRSKKGKKGGKGKGKDNPPLTDDTPPSLTDDGETLTDLQEQLHELNETKYENAPDIEINISDADEMSKQIAKDYTHNMEYWVKNWETKNIIKMREDVLKMVQDGARPITIEKYLNKRWKIAGYKAKFLAENESNLASSVIKATRYQQIGCTKFKWTRSSSREKRELHKKYYGEIFEFANPPVIVELPTKEGRKEGLPDPNGQRGLPRQTYNCKCHMSPILDDLNISRIIDAKKNIIERIKNAITNRAKCNNNPWRYRRYGEG